MSKMYFKVVGINADNKTYKVAQWLCRKYPNLSDASGKRPSIVLRHKPYKGKYRSQDDDDAIRVYISHEDNLYPLGWITKQGNPAPNTVVKKLIENDMIKEVKLDRLGKFKPEDKDKLMYFAEVEVNVIME